MTTRSPPKLVDIRCPHCDRLWFKYAEAGDSDQSEIKCGCKRLLLYRVISGRVTVIHTR